MKDGTTMAACLLLLVSLMLGLYGCGETERDRLERENAELRFALDQCVNNRDRGLGARLLDQIGGDIERRADRELDRLLEERE